MHCKNCSNEILDGSKFCKFCGAVQEVAPEQVTYVQEPIIEHVMYEQPTASFQQVENGQQQAYTAPIPPPGYTYGPPVGVTQNAATQTGKKFLHMLKFRDANPPAEIADSIFWINWLRGLAVILFWVSVAGIAIGALAALFSAFGAASYMYGNSAGYILGALLGTVIGVLVALFLLITSIAFYMLILNWARDTAYLRANTNKKE